MGVSNHLLGILNFLTALLSVPVLGAGIWLATRAHSTDCVRFLQWPIIVIGIFMLLVSIAGLCGVWRRLTWLLYLYLAVMLVLILLLLCFTIFAFVVTNKGAGDAVSGKGFREYHLGNYSTWLQRYLINSAGRWEKIQSCLADSHVCQQLDNEFTSQDQFDQASLSPIESGCCKPPTTCGYAFVTPTNWTGSALNTTDADCDAWSNSPSQLCYECSSCKAGVLESVKESWRKVAIVNVVVFLLTVVVYSVGCCALRNVKREKHYGYV